MQAALNKIKVERETVRNILALAIDAAENVPP